MARFPQWGNNTKNDFISAVQRAFNWAVEQELIATSPFARMKKPGRKARELAISPAEYAAITGAIREGAFLDLVELAWETGARVQELRILEAQHVDLGHGRIVLPPSKAKGKKHYRVIYLTDRAKAIIARLVGARPEGPLLLNARGKPWTKDAINCAFTRLSKKLGKKYHLGALRKGFATEALKNGLDTICRPEHVDRASQVRHRGAEKRARHGDGRAPAWARGHQHGQPCLREGAAGSRLHGRSHEAGEGLLRFTIGLRRGRSA